jgi:DNA polymerase IV
VIQAREVRELLDPLPVSKIFGVGPRTALRLEALGVRTIGDLARRDKAEVAREFGATGVWIHDLAHGIDTRRVNPRREEKSHGMERTFATDVSDREELRLMLLSFCEEVAFGLRDKGLRGRTVTLKARFADFTTITRTKTLDHPTNLGPRIYTVARELLQKVPPGALRLIGVQLSGLSDVRVPAQETLFGDAASSPSGASYEARLKLERATESLDRIRRKFGERAVVPASLLGRERPRGLDGSDGKPERDGGA